MAQIVTAFYNLKVRPDAQEAEQALDRLKQKAEGLGEAAQPKVEFKNINELTQDLNDLRKVRDNALDFDTAKTAAAEINRVEKQVEELNADLGKVGGGNTFQRLGAQVKSSVGDIGKIAVGSFIGTGVADAVTQGLKAVIDIGSEFQAGVAELSAITGIGGQALDDLGGKARSLALEFGTSASDQLNSFKGILSRLGPDIASVPEALSSITESVNILSKATGDDAAASMDALTTAALQFGTDLSDPTAAAEDITRKMNTLAAGAKVGAAEVPQVAEAIKQAGVAAKGANLSFEETNAAIQVLAAGGKFGSEGGVAIRNVIGLIQKQSKVGEDALKSLGTSTDELGKLLTEQGLNAALEKLSGALETVGSDAERNKIKMTLFGQENAAAAGILLDNTAKLREFTAGVTDTNTAVEQAAIRQATFQERLAKVGAFFEDLAITVFQGVGDGIAFIADNFEELTTVILPPIGAVVSLVKNFDNLVAVGQDVANFLGLISDIDLANANAGRSVERATEAFEEYNKKVGEVNDTLKNATAQVDAAKRLEELSNKTSLTQKEQEELAKATAKLADEFPEATAGINDLTGEYELNIAKLKEFAKEQENVAGDERKRLIEENLLGPTRDMLPALDAQKEKLRELRAELDEAIQEGDKEAILESRDAYEEQRVAIKGTTEQLGKNIEALIQSGAVGKGSAEEIARGLGISREEAEKLVPKVREINAGLEEQKQKADAVARSAAGMAEAFGEAMQAAKAQTDEALGALNKIDADILEAKRNGDRARVEELQAERKLQRDKLIEADRGADELANIDERNRKLIEDKRTAAGQSEFERRRARTELEAKVRETDTTKLETQIAEAALAAFRAGARKQSELSASEQARIARERKASLEQQLADLKNISGDLNAGINLGVKESDKPKVKADLEATIADLQKSIADADKNLLSLEPVIRKEDLQKFATDIQTGLDAVLAKEVEVGIRPKEEGLEGMSRQLKALADQVAETELTLQLDANGDPIGVLADGFKNLTKEQQAAQTESLKLINDLTLKRLDLEKRRNDTIAGFDRELADARIANIAVESERELQALEQKQQRELDFFRTREASGIDLTEREAQLKAEIEKRHNRERLDLLRKQYREELDLATSVAKAAGQSFIDVFRKVADERKALSEEEVDQKQEQFAKESEDLRKALGRGELSFESYSRKVQQLAKRRADFESELEDQKQGSIAKSLATGYGAAIDAAGKYFEQLFQKYVIDAALTQIMEAQKTASVTAGTASRIALNEQAAASDLARAQKSGVAGATDVAASAIAALPFPINLIAAAAASIAFSKLISGLTSLIKFEHGGLGLVGEKGPEIIGPTKDFSQFASQLITQTVKATQRSLGTESGSAVGSRRSSKLRIEGGVELSASGRSLQATLTRESLSARLESATG